MKTEHAADKLGEQYKAEILLRIDREQQLAAERENTKFAQDHIDIYHKDNQQLREQLAAAQAANRKAVKVLEHSDIPLHRETVKALGAIDTTALDALIAGAYDHARKEADRDWQDVLSAAQQPLMDALMRMPEVAYETIINGAGVSLENLPNELQCICDAAFAKVGK